MNKIIIFLILLAVIGSFFYTVPGTVGKTLKEENHPWQFDNEKYVLKIRMVDSGREINTFQSGSFYVINMSIPWSDYQHYKIFPGAYRYAFNSSYLSYFMTVHDPDIVNLSNVLNNISRANDFDRLTELNFILSFVQCAMSYYTDINTTGFVDYYRFPLETLVEGGGDCEDTSLLLFTIAYILGYDVSLIVMNVTASTGVYGHVAVGVHLKRAEITGPYARYLRDGYYHDGKLYYYMETTTNESVGFGLRIHYYVGISPEEAGYTIKNIRFVSYNNYTYSGYTSNDKYVKNQLVTHEFPIFLFIILTLLAIYIPLAILSVLNENKICPNCGREVRDTYNYCPYCGFWLTYDEPPPPPNDVKNIK